MQVQLPVEPFLAAGITKGEDGGMVSMNLQEQQWRAARDWADPFMEFCLGWLRRNPPWVRMSLSAAARSPSRWVKTFRSSFPERYGQGDGAVR